MIPKPNHGTSGYYTLFLSTVSFVRVCSFGGPVSEWVYQSSKARVEREKNDRRWDRGSERSHPQLAHRNRQQNKSVMLYNTVASFFILFFSFLCDFFSFSLSLQLNMSLEHIHNRPTWYVTTLRIDCNLYGNRVGKKRAEHNNGRTRTTERVHYHNGRVRNAGDEKKQSKIRKKTASYS